MRCFAIGSSSRHGTRHWRQDVPLTFARLSTARKLREPQPWRVSRRLVKQQRAVRSSVGEPSMTLTPTAKSTSLEAPPAHPPSPVPSSLSPARAAVPLDLPVSLVLEGHSRAGSLACDFTRYGCVHSRSTEITRHHTPNYPVPRRLFLVTLEVREEFMASATQNKASHGRSEHHASTDSATTRTAPTARGQSPRPLPVAWAPWKSMPPPGSSR